MDVFRILRGVKAYFQYLRRILFYLVHRGLDYFNPTQFQDSWWVISVLVSYGINPALCLLAWLLRKRKLDVLTKGCAEPSTKDIEKQIVKTIINDQAKQRIQVFDRPWKQALDDGQQPVIVFCVISSRIGTDIENAMRGVNGKSPVVLVLLHCVLSALLRGDLSDDEELLDPEMKKRMTGITHFAFSDREGLYSCHQNTVGFEQLIDIVRSLDG